MQELSGGRIDGTAQEAKHVAKATGRRNWSHKEEVVICMIRVHTQSVEMKGILSRRLSTQFMSTNSCRNKFE